MIFGIDHVALSSSDPLRDALSLEKLGYKKIFHEKGKRNPSIKRGLMHSFGQTHDLLLMRKEGSIGIELIDHGGMSENQGYVLPVFDNAPEGMCTAKVEAAISAVEMFGLGSCFVPTLQARVLAAKSGGRFEFSGAAFLTASLEESVGFWRGLGFGIMERSDKIARMEFRPPLAKTPSMFFLVAANGERPALDDAGFNCVALVSNSADKEMRELAAQGFYTTQLEEFEVGGKKLSIFFARGPGGEIVEILGIEKMARR